MFGYYPTFHTLTSVGRKSTFRMLKYLLSKSTFGMLTYFQYAENMFPLFFSILIFNTVPFCRFDFLIKIPSNRFNN